MVWYANSAGRYGANGAKGDAGEAIVEQYCKDNGIPFVETNDAFSQVKLKIDCIIDNVTVDVKSNYFKGFLCVELANNRKGKPGWLYTTTAKQIYGVDVDSKSIFRYNVDEMVNYVKDNPTKAKKTKHGDLVMWVPVTESIIERLQ